MGKQHAHARQETGSKRKAEAESSGAEAAQPRAPLAISVPKAGAAERRQLGELNHKKDILNKHKTQAENATGLDPDLSLDPKAQLMAALEEEDEENWSAKAIAMFSRNPELLVQFIVQPPSGGSFPGCLYAASAADVIGAVPVVTRALSTSYPSLDALFMCLITGPVPCAMCSNVLLVFDALLRREPQALGSWLVARPAVASRVLGCWRRA